MNKGLRIGILGAGLGSRMQTRSKAKPLAKLGDATLLSLLLTEIDSLSPSAVFCALRDELLSPEDKAQLPMGPQYLFVNTDSSLHTLKELLLSMGPASSALFTMADTIIKPADFQNYARFCADLEPGVSAILVTPFVDDEKPLWVRVDSQGSVTKFGPESGDYVTSGMYFLSPAAMNLALLCVDQGMEKMRNFLAAMLEAKLPIKSFVVSKTIDVDHPSDLLKAEEFLQGH